MPLPATQPAAAMRIARSASVVGVGPGDAAVRVRPRLPDQGGLVELAPALGERAQDLGPQLRFLGAVRAGAAGVRGLVKAAWEKQQGPCAAVEAFLRLVLGWLPQHAIDVRQGP
jgi:hypothetical protein